MFMGTPFYSQIKLLKLVDLFRLETALLVFKIKNKTLPAQFCNYINKVNGYISKKSTRSNTKKNNFIPFSKKTKSQRSIKYHDPHIWKSLDLDIKNSKFLKSLIQLKLKLSFLNKYN